MSKMPVGRKIKPRDFAKQSAAQALGKGTKPSPPPSPAVRSIGDYPKGHPGSK